MDGWARKMNTRAMAMAMGWNAKRSGVQGIELGKGVGEGNPRRRKKTNAVCRRKKIRFRSTRELQPWAEMVLGNIRRLQRRLEFMTHELSIGYMNSMKAEQVNA